VNKYPYATAEKLVRRIRPHISFSGPRLFHGTRTPCMIAMQNVLRCPPHGAISFTRLLHVAAYWAVLPRSGVDEQHGAIIILDRTKLAQQYKLECYRDDVWDEDPERAARKSFEAEERVVDRHIKNLNRYIVDVIWLEAPACWSITKSNSMALSPMPVAHELMTWAHNRLLTKPVRTGAQRAFKQRPARRDHHRELASRQPILISQTI
jgi:hypothetical protein